MEKAEEKKKTGTKLLAECESAPEYTGLAIYDQGEIVTTSCTSETFLDCVETFALIKKLPDVPLGHLSMGLTAYSTTNTDYDLGRITELSTWQAMVKNHFTDVLKDKEDNALRFALTSKFPIPTEVFDLLYAAYPETSLEDILYDCKRLEAVKWAMANGVDKFYDGFREPMQKILSWTKRGPEADAIYRYLYDTDPENYGKNCEGC